MRPVTIILLVVALGIAGATAFMAKRFLATQTAQTDTMKAGGPKAVATKDILIASRDIKLGATVGRGDMEWKAWPEDLIDKGRYIVKAGRDDALDTYAGSIARTAFVSGEPIQATRLFKQSDAGFLSGMLTPGMRAVGVPIKPETGVGGFVLPGDRVDVLMAYPIKVKTGPNSGAIPPSKSNVYQNASQTVLRDVRVLAVDQTMQGNEDGAVKAKTVTLEVTPSGAEIIALAQQLGAMSLSLRSLAPGADEDAYPESTTDLQMAAALRAAVLGSPLGGFQAAPQPQPVMTKPKVTVRRTTAPRSTGGGSTTVKVYRGNISTVEKVAK